MRLFVSLRPPADAVADLRARQPSWSSDPGQWHVTLAFLGEAEKEPVDAALRTGLAGQPGLELRLEGSGAFGRNGPVWVGVGGDLPALHDLASTVATAAREAGLQLERRTYRPHLTVGKRGHPNPALLASYRGPAWQAREVELVRSDLGRRAVHTVLERYPLG